MDLPLDVIDLGIEDVLHEVLEDAHVGGLSIATSYHAGRFSSRAARSARSTSPKTARSTSSLTFLSIGTVRSSRRSLRSLRVDGTSCGSFRD